MPQPLIELGGDPQSPTLHIALANGFVPQTYLPLLRPLMQAYRVVCLPPRALWGEGEPPPITPDSHWDTVRDDLLAGMDAYGLERVVAIGHSMGGIASLKAGLIAPGRFDAIILLDPTILTPEICQMIEQARQAGMADQHPLAQGAMRRRNRFASADEAFEHFRAKRLFADWSDEVLRAYAVDGTMPAPDGDGVVLRWSPAWEAYYFSTGATEIWDILPDVERLLQAHDLPLLIVNGATSDTYLPDSAERVRQLVPGADYATIEGHGHLFPQSAPQVSAERITGWLGRRLNVTF